MGLFDKITKLFTDEYKEGDSHPFFPETGYPLTYSNLSSLSEIMKVGRTVELAQSGIVGKIIEISDDEKYARVEIAKGLVITVNIRKAIYRS